MTTVVVRSSNTPVRVQGSNVGVNVASGIGRRGPPGPAGPSGAGTTFTQASPSGTWTINHNLGYRPSVEIIDAGGNEVEATVTHTSLNQTVVTFTTPIAGIARLN